MEWKPIETAPQDGTEIILHDPSHPRIVLEGYWDDEEHDWVASAMCFEELAPTHWMSLPEAPKGI